MWRRALRPRGLLLTMAVLTAVTAVAVAAAWVTTDLRQTRNAVDVRLAAAAQVLDEQTGRILDGAEMLLRGLSERAVERGLSAAADRAAAAGAMAAVPAVANVYLTDAHGRLLLDARGFHPVGSNFADRDWVRGLLADPGRASYLGPAAFDDAARVHAFPLARRIVDGRGTLLGLAVALVDLESFKRLHQRLDLGAGQSLGVYGRDGALLVRQPMKAEDVGRSFAGTPLFSHLARAAADTYRGRSPYDAQDRVMSYRLMDGRPLVVWVSVPEAAAMDGWRLRGLSVLALTGVGLVVILTLTGLIWRGLTREHRETADLANLNRDLERSNADLEQFAYIASHDLKEPLRNIASYVQLLQRRYQGRLDPDADAFIGYTVDGVRRMQSIINELLAYSRIGTGQLTLVPVQAGILVSTALAHLKGVIAEAQAAVEVKGPLPVVEADAAQLGSLFQNLIANALKYRRDDVRPEVLIGCDDRGATWEFYVRDNGIGIDAQYHRQIFDLFKRLHPRDRYPGTGIGLAICQRVVERHGGRIWVDSVAGQGSTFRFTLPKSREA